VRVGTRGEHRRRERRNGRQAAKPPGSGEEHAPSIACSSLGGFAAWRPSRQLQYDKRVDVIVTVHVDAVVDGDGDGDVIDVIGKAW
jgi:hypothetical protein